MHRNSSGRVKGRKQGICQLHSLPQEDWVIREGEGTQKSTQVPDGGLEKGHAVVLLKVQGADKVAGTLKLLLHIHQIHGVQGIDQRDSPAIPA